MLVHSKKLLAHVYQLITESGYVVNNIDSTIIIEKPKLRDYIDAMRETIAKLLNLRLDQVSIKSKTSEKIGIVGRGEAAIAEAIVLLVKKTEKKV